MGAKTTADDDEYSQVSHKVIVLQAGVLAVVCGVVCGLGLFLMTAWLLIKGGRNVGAHLRLLGQYLIGYSVTWTGSLVGLLYGLVIGAIIGWTIGKIYNLVAQARQR